MNIRRRDVSGSVTGGYLKDLPEPRLRKFVGTVGENRRGALSVAHYENVGMHYYIKCTVEGNPIAGLHDGELTWIYAWDDTESKSQYFTPVGEGVSRVDTPGEAFGSIDLVIKEALERYGPCINFDHKYHGLPVFDLASASDEQIEAFPHVSDLVYKILLMYGDDESDVELTEAQARFKQFEGEYAKWFKERLNEQAR